MERGGGATTRSGYKRRIFPFFFRIRSLEEGRGERDICIMETRVEEMDGRARCDFTRPSARDLYRRG